MKLGLEIDQKSIKFYFLNLIKIGQNITPKWVLEGVPGPLGGGLGPPEGVGALLGGLGAQERKNSAPGGEAYRNLGASWGRLGALLGPSWAVLPLKRAPRWQKNRSKIRPKNSCLSTSVLKAILEDLGSQNGGKLGPQIDQKSM